MLRASGVALPGLASIDLSVSECLNREWLLNLREARVVIEDWRQKYNMERPHSRLGYLSPERFIANQKVSP